MTYIEAKKAELRNLKCVNGAMYFGAVEDDSCDCKTRCQNEQTYEHALEELDSFLESFLSEIEEEMKETLEVSYSEHDYYTDDTLRYHGKQKKVFAKAFQHLRTGVESN